MATLKIQAPDGKTIRINVPEGTDPSQYDQIVEDVISDYSPKSSNKTPPQDLSLGLRAMTGSISPVPPQLVPPEGRAPFTTSEQAGSMVAEKAVEAGVNPIVAGTGYLIPSLSKDALLGDAIGVPIAKGLAKVAKPVVGQVNKLRKLIKSPGEAQARATAERTLKETATKRSRSELVKSLSEKRVEPLVKQKGILLEEQKMAPQMELAEKAKLQKTLGKSKESIEALESEKGLSFKQLGVPEAVPMEQTAQFNQVLQNVANKTPKELMESMDPAGIQMLRKQMKTYAKTAGSDVQGLVGKADEVLGKTMDEIIGQDYASARQVFGESKKAMSELPAQFKSDKSKIGVQIQKLSNEIKEKETLAKKIMARAKKSDQRSKMGLQTKMAKMVEEATIRDAKLRKLKAIAMAGGAAALGGGSLVGLGTAIFK